MTNLFFDAVAWLERGETIEESSKSEDPHFNFLRGFIIHIIAERNLRVLTAKALADASS